MFKKASFRLAAIYLLIQMIITVSFSFSLYKVSSRELNRTLDAQVVALRHEPRLRFENPDDIRGFVNNRAQDFEDARERLKGQLVLADIIILVVSGFMCYALARKALEPIEQAHESQKRFTSDASHELRTPIAAMQTEIEVSLRDKNLSLDEAKSVLNSNLEELSRLTNLTEGLLKLGELGEKGLNITSVRLQEVIDSSVTRIYPLAKSKDIKITSPKNQNTNIKVDQNAIQEVLVNLLENAVKYSPEKSEVKIEAKKKLGKVELSIADQGPGISEKDLEHIYERFYRSDASRTKTGKKGYGLGLAIAKQIIDHHGYSISAKSKIGHGTTFTISIDLR